MPMITGVVLAGGSSRRLGQDKALLRLTPDAPTFLEQAARTLDEICGRVLVVAPEERGYLVDGAEVVADRWPDSGPVGGMLTAFEVISDGTALILACDYPLVPAGLLRELIQNDQDAPALVPCTVGKGRIHPLVGRYAVTYWTPRFHDAMVTGERRLQRVVEQGEVKHFVIDEKRWGYGALLNVNTRDELVRARSLLTTGRSFT